jgi:hypothetical protein
MVIPIGAAILVLAGKIYAITQAIKKSPWLEAIFNKYLSPWGPIALAVVAALTLGIVDYGQDGLTIQEILTILGALVTAMGGHFGLSLLRGKEDGK